MAAALQQNKNKKIRAKKCQNKLEDIQGRVAQA